MQTPETTKCQLMKRDNSPQEAERFRSRLGRMRSEIGHAVYSRLEPGELECRRVALGIVVFYVELGDIQVEQARV